MSDWPSAGSECVFSPEFRVAGAMLEWHQEVDTQPDHLIAIPSEHGRSALVDIPDDACAIHHQDGVRRRIKDFSKEGTCEHDVRSDP